VDTPSCRDCGVELREGDNWYDSDAETHHYICKECRKAAARRRRVNNPTTALLRAARRRAQSREVDFDLSPSDLRVPNYCPILGIRLRTAKDTPKKHSPSLDRIDPDLGYVRGNVQVISHRANTLKNNGTLEELQLVVQHLRDIRRRNDDA